MRSVEKTILFVRIKVAGKISQHPVAIFANEARAGDFAREMKVAQDRSDVSRQLELWPDHPVAEDGMTRPVDRFVRVSLPYQPSTTGDVSDLFADEPAETK